MATQLTCSLCGTGVEATRTGWASSDECPGCSLRKRHRAAGAYLAHTGVLETAKSILVCHAGPEERRYLFGDQREIVNFDVRPASFANKVMDIQDMQSIESGSVDLFVALHVLNHVHDDARALAEIRRVLKPGSGIFVATVPARSGQPTEKLADVTVPYGAEALAKYGVGSFRRYGVEDFRWRLEGLFAVAEYRFADSLVRETETVFQGRRLAS